MKISIWGMNPERGQPLACILRSYGRHSVVGFGGPLIADSPDPEVRQLMVTPVEMPMAPSAEAALREGSELAIIASSFPAASLNMVSAVATRLGLHHVPTVVVTQTQEHIATRFALTIGYAPFSFRPERAIERLLGLRRVAIRAGQPGAVEALHRAVSGAWSWVDNKIPVEVTFPVS